MQRQTKLLIYKDSGFSFCMFIITALLLFVSYDLTALPSLVVLLQVHT